MGMRKILTNEIVDERIKDRPIIRLDNIDDAKSKINWKCKKCNNIWNTTTRIILSGCGCPNCVERKVTNEKIDERMKGRTIVRVGNYNSNKYAKIEWKCLVCNYHYPAPTRTVVDRKYGCPKCAGQIPLTNDEMDNRIKDLKIKRLDDVKKSYDDIRWQCLDPNCNYIWPATPSNISKCKGCPKCNHSIPLTNKLIDERLEGRPIKRVSNFKVSRIPVKFKCLVFGCDYIWKTHVQHVLKENGTGCPKCAGLSPLTNKIVDERLEGRPIKRLDSYDPYKKMRWKCLNDGCNHIWKTVASSIINNGSGCPACKSSKGETVIADYCKSKGYNYIREHTFKDCRDKRLLRFDFWIPELNLIIEFHGEQHDHPVAFGGKEDNIFDRFVEALKRDNIKKNYCINNNINFIEISYLQFDNIEKILDEKLGELKLKMMSNKAI